jgi:hypothetical protein
MKQLIGILFAFASLGAPAHAGTCSTFHTPWGDQVKCDNGTSSWSSATPYGTQTTVQPGHGAPAQHCWTSAPSPFAGDRTTTCHSR